jgi:two-component system sensor histidine kinase KdpD
MAILLQSRSRPPVTEDILATTAHELRLPLSHIKGFVTTLRRTDVEWDAETRTEFLAEIELEADRLAQLVESLLEEHPQHGGKQLSENLALTHPASVVQGALHRVRGLLGERPLRIAMESALPSVRMNASQMERVLANLTLNAIKYSPPGTAIGVSARITEIGELEFSVEDEGPGVPSEDRERIFEPFVRRLTDDHSDVPGHGLGLAICQSIVLAHGGHILVSDRNGGGARFSVFLPTQLHAVELDTNHARKDGSNDSAKHSGSRRRSADAKAPRRELEGERIRGSVGYGWYGGCETHRGAHLQLAAP